MTPAGESMLLHLALQPLPSSPSILSPCRSLSRRISSFTSRNHTAKRFSTSRSAFALLPSSKDSTQSSQGSVLLFIQPSAQMCHVRLFYFLHSTCDTFLFVSLFVACLSSVNVSLPKTRILSFTPIYPKAKTVCGAY